MSIQEHLNKIRNAIKGSEVRESIAKGIETAYDDASENGNANMEVKIARGTHPNLRSRLEEVDNKQQQTTTQLAQKADKGNVSVSDINKNLGKFDETYMSDVFLQQMAGNAPISSIPATRSVTSEKLADKSVRMDKMDDYTKAFLGIEDVYQTFKYNEIESGEVPTATPPLDATRIIFPPVEKGGIIKRLKIISANTAPYVIKTFKKNDSDKYEATSRYSIQLNEGENIVEVDIPINEGEFIGYYCETSTVRTRSSSSHWVGNASGDVDNGTFQTTSQRAFFEVDIEYLAELNKRAEHIEPTEIKGVSKVEPSVNLFDKETVIPGGYFSTATGEWLSSGSHVSSDFIPVSIGRYRKSNTGGFALWDKDKNHIRGTNNRIVPINDNEEEVAFVTFSVPVSDIDSFMFTKEEEYPEEYIPHIKEEYYFSDKWNVSNTNDEETVIAPINRINPNMRPLYIKTSDGYNQPYHPSVLYIDEGFNGYKWWMVQTPYPKYNQSYIDRYEVPHIHCSKDGVNWEEPVGLKNPIDDLIPEQIGTRSFMSDPHLVYREDLGRLEAWYRITDRGLHYEDYSLPTFVIRKTSIDGVNWSEREIMIDLQEPETNGVGDMVRSPALWFEDGKYRMWFVDKIAGGGQRRAVYAESNDGFMWKNRTQCDLKGNPTQWDTIWHIDVFYHDGLYHLLNHPSATAAQEQLDYYVSEDGINFDFVKTVLEQSNVDNSFYKDGFYRSCLAHDGQEFYLYFCGDDDENKIARIGLLKGKSVENLYSVDGGQEEGYVEFTNGIAIHNDDIRNDSYIELTTKGTRIGVEYDTERVFVEKSDGTKIYLND